MTDANLAVENLLIGLPVLQHPGVDTKSLFEKRRDLLCCADCSSIGISHIGMSGGQVSRLMIARLSRLPNSFVPRGTSPVDSRPRVNYFTIKEKQYPFRDSSYMDPVDFDQLEEVCVAVEKMVDLGATNGFPSAKLPQLQKWVLHHTDLFRTSFSSGPPADISLLKIELLSDDRPVCVRLLNYSQEQRAFLSGMVKH